VLKASAAVLAVLVAACSDSVTSPNQPMRTAGSANRSTTSSGLIPTQGLLRTTPLAQTIVVTKTLSRGGGGINIPGTDFQLQVPNGAFDGESMTFTITAYAGSVVAYDFQPHGVTFNKPLKAVQQLGHTNWKSYNLPAGTYWAGAYFADPSQIDMNTGAALVNEFEQTAVQVGGATMSWSIPHFSGYLVAAGRDDGEDIQYDQSALSVLQLNASPREGIMSLAALNPLMPAHNRTALRSVRLSIAAATNHSKRKGGYILASG
jgi:hypothetical protein